MKRPAQNGFTPVRRSAEHGFTPVRRSAEHGFTPVRRSAEHGFTLVELMVSLLIFGILSAAGVALLTFSVRAQDAANVRLAEMAEIRRLGAVLTSDLAQVVPRMPRDARGDRIPAFSAAAPGGQAPLLGFVRSGWSNGTGAARASLQRVEYRFENGNLMRAGFAMLDGGEELPAAVVFDDIESIRLRFRVDDEWRDAWDATQPEAMPDAVDLMIKPIGGPEIRQLFLVGARY
ncbi:type II secretion system minor pseudopilin GspJ [Sphingomonas sp. LaA6.9]|uniref:type II secretion system minor pseudopilin GspJ n=1 Tax=Sphingomonas sp. LaA6.9 TaxID=2919914 RepID=UPI001F4FFEE8|nr:type II secretion system minor pseudopilin GspJ [Sphingomonas sp. LaA6.9]MCJ8157591.1 type II secretion system minor pseudopilin GspJ [Sphingomonas sp. LaA6.9]